MDYAYGRDARDWTIVREFSACIRGRKNVCRRLTDVKGSAGYVAIERVTGTLHGRRGSFLLLHRGIMSQGAQDLAITVVPDSGAGELAGLSGKLDIKIVDRLPFSFLIFPAKVAPRMNPATLKYFLLTTGLSY